MAQYKIVKIGHPTLRRPAESVNRRSLQDAKVKKLLKDMVLMMRTHEGVGLAANQIGLGVQVIVLECQQNQRYPDAEGFPLEIWINPKIMEYSKKKILDWEGCLSIPGYRGTVARSEWVVLKALNPEGKMITKKVSGFQARVIQHEIDHLNGCFYMDRMRDLKTWIHLDEFSHLLQSSIQDR